jgi:hypothetical protein
MKTHGSKHAHRFDIMARIAGESVLVAILEGLDTHRRQLLSLQESVDDSKNYLGPGPTGTVPDWEANGGVVTLGMVSRS